jgi:hypothetical protein
MSKDSLLTRRRAIATIGAAGTLLLPSRLNLAAGTPHPDIAFGTVFELPTRKLQMPKNLATCVRSF